MKEFLKSVVEHYLPEVVKSDGKIDPMGLTEYLFVFPNHRSGLFFLHYLHESVGKPIFAPDLTTISDLFLRLNGERHLRIPERIELLFYLYDVYKQVSHSNETFDNFVFWGEMLLSDFNDADKYLVDTRLLFENVKDLKEIDNVFGGLEEEQIKVIKTFWTNFCPDKKGVTKESFRDMWEILYEVYTKFREVLLQNGCAYDGMLQRLIVEGFGNLNFDFDYCVNFAFDFDIDVAKRRLQKIFGKKIVFVGLTALSKTELKLMQYLNKYGIAEFCWDYADSRLRNKNSHASFFKAATLDSFPNILDEDKLKAGLVPDKEKDIEVIEVPSGVGQTVQAANILRDLSKEGCDAFRTAVVLPDEKLLLPMLYSVPKEYHPFNVTMGYSLRSTSIATFIDNLLQLQANLQINKQGKTTFYYKNVLPLLSSNYLLRMSDGKAEEIAKDIVKNNKYRVSPSVFKGNNLLEKVFKPCANGLDCIKYLKDILDILARQAEKELEEKAQAEEQDQADLFGELAEAERMPGVFSEVEREFLFSYVTLVERLERCIMKFQTEISASTFFALLHKLAQTESVAFSGEPLSGLQVMGVLETRDVDFDNLIILSMNEGVFPAKPSSNTFIPMNLRFAFGMPTFAHKDAVYAYHFYRLISRAKKVYLIYDSRNDGMQSGEPSRYIKQLSYLYGFKPKFKTIQYNIGIEDVAPIAVVKDQHVMDALNRCKSESGTRTLSASSLKRYISCPLEFYFSFVERMREDDEIEESIDDKAFGNILHATMQELYGEALYGKIITSALLDDWIKDKERLRRVIERHFYEEMNITEITGYLALVADVILTYVTDILEHDKRCCPFEYVASEYQRDYVYQVHDDAGNEKFKVKIRAIYDRIDRLQDGTLRIVDYKTGRTKDGNTPRAQVPKIDEVFSKNSKCSKEAFQLMLYALLYYLDKGDAVISPNLYFVREFHSDIEKRTELVYKGEETEAPITNFNIYREEFKKAFDHLLVEIFEPEIAFSQTEDENNSCGFCAFKDVCNKGLNLFDKY